MMDQQQIINLCEALADNFGETKAKFVCGELIRNARVYSCSDEDGNSVSIMIDPNTLATEVRIYGEGFTGAQEGNPAVCINNDGELIRWHGEMNKAVSLIEQEIEKMGLYL